MYADPRQDRRVSEHQVEVRIAESLDYGATLGLATTVAERLPSVRASNRHRLFAAKLTKFAAGGWSDSSPAKPFGPFLACCFDEL